MGRKGDSSDDSDPETEPEEESEDEPTPVVRSSAVKSKEPRPLPAGYVCKACGAVDAHAIYDCHLKVKKTKAPKEEMEEEKEVEKASKKAPFKSDSSADEGNVSKKQKTETSEAAIVGEVVNAEANALTVFVSGLPFRIKRHHLIDIFQKEGFAADVHGKDVRLVMFEDAPEKCRGLAYVTMHSAEDYAKALALTGRDFEGRQLGIVACRTQTQLFGDKGTPGACAGAIVGAAKKGKRGPPLPAGVQRMSRCYRCGGTHEAKDCTNQRVCYRCRSIEHLSSSCPMKGMPTKKSS
jgi:hypothetical protein